MSPGTVTIYHYPMCRKSRAALALLKQTGNEVKLRDYHKVPFTENELVDLLMRLNIKPQELFRTAEKEFLTRYRNKHFSDHEWIRILIENPGLVRRPVVVRGLKAVIGEKIEDVEELLSK